MATIHDEARRAEKLEEQKEYEQAAQIWERLHQLDKAIAAYKRGGRMDRAAILLLQDGRPKESAAMFMSLGQFMRAGALYERSHAYSEAARAYMRANERERAALMCEKNESFEDAAKIYYSIGNYTKAISLYEAAGQGDKVEAIRAKHGVQEDGGAQQAERLPSPDELFGDGSFVDERKVVEAVLQYLAAQRIAEAAQIYGRCREDLGYPVITAVSGHKVLEVATAKMFFAARDYHKAAQVLENIEQYAKAAELYERSDDFERAAEMYVETKNMLKAAQMYERAGNHQEAAEIYEREDVKDRAAVNYERSLNNYKAGSLFFEIEQYNKALQLLQKVQPDEYNHIDASFMIGQILASGGYADLALKRYAHILEGQEVNERLAPLFRHWGIICGKSAQVSKARELFEKILAWQFDYEDVSERLTGLDDAAQPPADSTASTQAPQEQEAPLVSMMDGFEFLRDTPLFAELSLDEIRTLYHMAELKEIPSSQVLIEQDQPGKALYIIRAGSAAVKKVTPEKEIDLVQLGPGSPVGEMSLFDDAPTSARVVAAGPLEVFEITKDRFTKLLEGSDKLALKIHRVFVQTLVQRLRDTTQKKVAGT
jgi:tetratricopeptide (TPR) repeat protein